MPKKEDKIMLNEENTVDSIQVISDGISAINFRLSDMLPTENGFDELEKQRDKALDRFHLLVKVFVTNSTLRFVKADGELAAANAKMKLTLKKLEHIQQVIDNVKTIHFSY